jgi:uncharacterized protein (TIGR03067 family)
MNAIIRWLDEPRSIRLGLSLIHFLWQGALLGAVAGMLMMWMKRASSRQRYAVLLTILFAMAVAPAVTFLVVSAPRQVTELPVEAAVAAAAPWEAEAILPSRLTATSVQPIASAGLDRPRNDVPTAAALVASSDVVRQSRLGLAWAWIVSHLTWIVGCWALGVLLFSVRLMIGVGGASRVRRKGVVRAPEICRVLCGELGARLGLRRVATICESALVRVPVVIGWFKPVVLLPASVLAEMPEAELRAIIAHELAHIRRHDYVVNLLQRFVETLLFYHPMVWWLSSAIRREREQCCDDLAADACGDKVVVAKALARLAEVRSVVAQTALAATGGRLARRIRRLLGEGIDPKQRIARRPLAGSCLTIAVVAIAVLIGCLLTDGTADHLAIAQVPDIASVADTHEAAQRQLTAKNERTAEEAVDPPASIDAVKTDMARLQGVWEVVSMTESGGPPTDPFDGFAIVGDTIFAGEKEHFKLVPSQNPNEMDVTDKHYGKERTAKWIYELDGDRLTIATKYDNERLKTFDSTPQNHVTKIVFKRLKLKDKDKVDNAARAAPGMPLLSEIPYVSRLFAMPANEDRAKEEAKKLQGVWEAVDCPVADREVSNIAIIGGTILCPAAFRYELHATQSPKALDFFERPGFMTSVVRLIYELDGNKLTVASTGGATRPKSFELTTENRVSKYIYKRAKADPVRTLLSAPISSMSFRDTPLRTVLDNFTRLTTLNIHVNQSTLKRLDISDQQHVTISLKDVVAADALRMVLESVDLRLTFAVQDKAIFVYACVPNSGATPDAAPDRDPFQHDPTNNFDLKRQLERLKKQNDEERWELERLERRLIDKDDAIGKDETPEKATEAALGHIPGHEPLGTKYRDHSCSDCHGETRTLKQITDLNLRRFREMQLRNQEQMDMAKLEGTWKVFSSKVDGKESPQHGPANHWVFRGRQVIVTFGSENSEELTPDDSRWNTFFINPTKSEKEMTIVGKSMLIQAIYRLDGDTLTVSYFGRAEADRPTSFTPQKDDLLPHLVFTLRRVDSTSKQSH